MTRNRTRLTRRVPLTYKLTALTPLLVGDGRELSPIDYMVWKDQVNVLDQGRIFKLLSRGPRLEGYLTQVRKATKLDFASWGGFLRKTFPSAGFHSRHPTRLPSGTQRLPSPCSFPPSLPIPAVLTSRVPRSRVRSALGSFFHGGLPQPLRRLPQRSKVIASLAVSLSRPRAAPERHR